MDIVFTIEIVRNINVEIIKNIMKENKSKIHEILRIHTQMRGIYELLWKFKVDIHELVRGYTC